MRGRHADALDAYPMPRFVMTMLVERGTRAAHAGMSLWARLVVEPDMSLPDDDAMLAALCRQSPAIWAKTRAALQPLLRSRKGRLSFRALDGARLRRKVATISGLLGRRCGQLYALADQTQIVRCAPGETTRQAIQRRDRTVRGLLGEIDDLWQRTENARRAYCIFLGRIFNERPLDDQIDKVRAWIEGRIAGLARHIGRPDLADGVSRSAIDWLIGQHEAGVVLAWADIAAALLFGRRFTEQWAAPRDGPAG